MLARDLIYNSVHVLNADILWTDSADRKSYHEEEQSEYVAMSPTSKIVTQNK